MGFSDERESHLSRFTSPDNPAKFPVSYSVVRPVDSDFAIPDYVSLLVWRCVYQIDKMLDASADSGDESIVIRLATQEKTQAAQNAIIREVLSTLSIQKDTRALGLLFGMQPVLMSISDGLLEGNKHQLVPVRISGYSEKTSVTARLETPLSEEIAKARIKFGVDDVFDTGHELALLLCDIEEYMFGESDRSIVDRMHNKDHKPLTDLRSLYDEIIPRFHKSGLVISVLSYKNMQFKQQLLNYLEQFPEPDEWCRHQNEMLYNSLDFGQFDWLVGSGLDTGISGEKIVTLLTHKGLLSGEMFKDPRVVNLIEVLRHSTFRIGSLSEGILKVNDANKFVDLILSEFLFYIVKFAEISSVSS